MTAIELFAAEGEKGEICRALLIPRHGTHVPASTVPPSTRFSRQMFRSRWRAGREILCMISDDTDEKCTGFREAKVKRMTSGCSRRNWRSRKSDLLPLPSSSVSRIFTCDPGDLHAHANSGKDEELPSILLFFPCSLRRESGQLWIPCSHLNFCSV